MVSLSNHERSFQKRQMNTAEWGAPANQRYQKDSALRHAQGERTCVTGRISRLRLLRRSCCSQPTMPDNQHHWR